MFISYRDSVTMVHVNEYYHFVTLRRSIWHSWSIESCFMHIYEFCWKTKMLGMMKDLIYPLPSFICEIKITHQIKL